MNSPHHLLVSAGVALLLAATAARADWKLVEGANTGGPGNAVEISRDGRPVARFVHGAGQFKPYLHIYGEAGELLTNGGLDAAGKTAGLYPHHRGIYIGWNKISSELGNFDLWHFNNGGKMSVKKFEQLDAAKDAATLVATIEWRGGKADASGSDLLLNETRTLIITRPEGKRTQVDAHFKLVAARDLSLGGDLQHAGIHFRASNEVSTRNKETAYVTDKDWTAGSRGPAKDDLKWIRLLFPIGERWYAASEFNAAGNPVEELSWRDYGRFGFFFKKELKQGATLAVDYRFVIELADAPAEKPKLSPEQLAKARAEGQARYADYVQSLKP